MADVTKLSRNMKYEIASYIKEDTLNVVNKTVAPIRPRSSFYTKYGKRFLDIIIGTIGFIVCIPINLIMFVTTMFDVGFPVLYKQKRIGLDGKEFYIYKFRNMNEEKDVNGELLPPSERVTKWGKFARKTSLDELLNFFSIIKGEMSVIGPRPLPDYYRERLNLRHQCIYKVKPGLECPTIHDLHHVLSWQERLDNYVWYVENVSFFVDLLLCFRLVAIAINKKNTNIRSNAVQSGFMGYNYDGTVINTNNVPDKYVELFCTNHGYVNLEEAYDSRIKVG